MEYCELKNKAMARFFSRSNEGQREAILRTDGALLITAGAGSGKTTMLVNRIANLLLFGKAYHSDEQPILSAANLSFLEDYVSEAVPSHSAENISKLSDIIGVDRVRPWQILAVTFTNKAAAELRGRLRNMGLVSLPSGSAEDIWAGTFHSCCIRILRRDAERIGYKQRFTVYDTDDSIAVIKDVMKSFGIDSKALQPRAVLTAISNLKNKLINPEDLQPSGDYWEENVRKIYTAYQKRLRTANAMDFDDIIMNTVKLLRDNDDVRQRWNRQFTYIMVDEYQDTNVAQYKLIALLAGGSGNLCVVGDEDQSIYKFRGATIENILTFEREFNACAVKLEQNYRSTQYILDAANSVITHNKQRRDKTLWSSLGGGTKPLFYTAPSERAEAAYVAEFITKYKADGGRYKDCAILYRNNDISRAFERAMSLAGIPFALVGGVRFFARMEVKDILAYLAMILNPYDEMSFRRVISKPKRGIGPATVDEIIRQAVESGDSPIDVCRNAETVFGNKSAALKKFAEMIDKWYKYYCEDGCTITELIDEVNSSSGYAAMLLADHEKGDERRANIGELKSYVVQFMDEVHKAASEPQSDGNAAGGDFVSGAEILSYKTPLELLDGFLARTTLESAVDRLETDENELINDKVLLMTMHSAKGLEFENVFVVAAEEGIFPGYRCLTDEDVEEERRLAYVAYTRAKRRLCITTAKERLLYGRSQYNKPSRFVKEIPEHLLETEVREEVKHEQKSKSLRREVDYLQRRLDEVKAKKAAIPNAAAIFTAGDRVTHKKFGDGAVLSVKMLGGESVLEIAFDTVGTKKISAKFGVTKL